MTTNDLFPSLMVEVCLVLAPDVNFFLNSRKQGVTRLAKSFLYLYLFQKLGLTASLVVRLIGLLLVFASQKKFHDV